MSIPTLKETGIFFQRIGRMDYYDLLSLGILPDVATGKFFRSRADYLKQLCLEHPEWHIISMVGDYAVNRFDPKAWSYYLGNGAKDPDLQLQATTVTLGHVREALEECRAIPVEQRTWKEQFTVDFCEKILANPGKPLHKHLLQMVNGDRRAT